jgi:hypothetical protein
MNSHSMSYFVSFFFFAAPAPLAAQVAQPAHLSAWQLNAQRTDHYEVSRDQKITFEGKPTARLQTNVETADLGSLYQSIDAQPYRGKRIRYATSAKVQGVEEWTGLWLRIEGAFIPFLAYADTHDVNLRDNREWTRLTIVIDVPEAAETIHLGLAQEGPGTSWFGPVSIETVDYRSDLSYRTAARNFETDPLSCHRSAPTGSHIPKFVCYNHRTGRTTYITRPNYVRDANLSGTRVGTPEGWLWIWG